MFSLLPNLSRAVRRCLPFVSVLLGIELLDELVFGLREAAWPLIRADLHLTYPQIGLLLSAPGVLGALVDPLLGVLGDQGWRRGLVLGGGLCFAAACAWSGLAPGFGSLLLAFVWLGSASGAFVSLAQATLIDTDPGRSEPLMARWTLAGALGVVGGPLLLSIATWLSLGWRSAFLLLAGLTLPMTAFAAAHPFPRSDTPAQGNLWAGLLAAGRALFRPAVLRWLVLLEFADFMLDVLLGFLALYLVDVAGWSVEQAALAVAVWTAASLLGDALLIPLLARVRGLTYLRVSAAGLLALYPGFLLAPNFELRLGLLALIGLLNSGGYAILKGQLYAALPGQSGTVLTIEALFGLVAKLLPALLGWAAERWGLPAAMWLLALGPAALLLGLPHPSAATSATPVIIDD